MRPCLLFGQSPAERARTHMMLIAGEMMSSYGMLVPATITISVANVVIGDRANYTSQPATRADSLTHRLSLSVPLLRVQVGMARFLPLYSAEEGLRKGTHTSDSVP